MKATCCFVLLCGMLLPACASGVGAEKDRTVTKVVKLLQKMLVESKKAGDTDDMLYAKYKCYCDTNTAEKSDIIDTKTKEIALFESQIEKLKAENAKLSKEVAGHKSDIEDTEAKQEAATSQRTSENNEYKMTKPDLEQGIASLREAIKVLSEIAADQTKSKGADHTKFMAGTALLKQQVSVKKKAFLANLKEQLNAALTAAATFVPQEKRQPVLELLQGPTFTATFTTQSVEVMGILKEMLDTMEANLAEVIEKEKTAEDAYKELGEMMAGEVKTMKSLSAKKDNTLSGNDEALAAAETGLKSATVALADAEGFLANLTAMCKTKADEYTSRKVMRANEDAAIAQAIAILNSDEAFALFGKVDATSVGAKKPSKVGTPGQSKYGPGKSGKPTKYVKSAPTGKGGPPRKSGPPRLVQMKYSFLQLDRISSESALELVDHLRVAVRVQKSMKLAKVLHMLQDGNPFKVVLAEIAKMQKVISEEAKQDEEQVEYCNSERDEKGKFLKEKNDAIIELNERESQVSNMIYNENSGLKTLIAETDSELKENGEDKETETSERKEEQAAYQADLANLVDAESLLNKAIAVLTKFYDSLAVLQKQTHKHEKHRQEPPETWGADYEGQSYAGNGAISMLKFILTETGKEKAMAMDDEIKAQHDYEDSMAGLASSDEQLLDQLARMKEKTAEEEIKLAQTQDNLKATISEKKTLEDYLTSIKPGCDFITDNFELRKTNRAEESKQLTFAIKTITETPAYQAAENKAYEEALGDCKKVCSKETESHAPCQACLKDVTLVAYCAGSPAVTIGCPA